MTDLEAQDITTFSQLGLGEPVLKAIDELGFQTPTPIQAAAFGPAKAGRDIVARARTGTGKTAAFGLPLVDALIDPELGTQALILAPTRELALQSARQIETLGKYRNVSVVAVYGGASFEKQVKEIEGGKQIISGTPGRVLDHLKRKTINPESLKILVLDEADEMLSMGFAEEIQAIMSLLPKGRQTLLFSATIDSRVERLAERMNEPARIDLSSDAVGARGIDHFLFLVSGSGRIADLIRILDNDDPESAIIFCNTKAETENVAERLKAHGFEAAWLNGDLPQRERERVMSKAREGKIRFLVATDVAARGIDISHVTHVINFTFPQDPAQYVHRTGRTGRAGRTGTAFSLVSPQELGALYYLRLQYRIRPIERNVPGNIEQATAKERDLIDLLAEGLPTTHSQRSIAIAKRVLTHHEAESLVAGLVGTLLNEEADRTEEAASARRQKAPRPTPPPPAPQPHSTSPSSASSAASRGRPSRPKSLAPDRPDKGTAGLWLDIGSAHGVRERELVELAAQRSGLSKNQIEAVDIGTSATFIRASASALDVISSALDGYEYCEQMLWPERV